ncbi:MAG: DUF444 family protein [Lentisphaeraceae bacterium]|nr:DUF444 family protein [Lentisphaeraceae bacterium]
MIDAGNNKLPTGLFAEDKINSNESEGAFNEFIDDKLKDLVENIINEGDLTSFGERDSDIIVETDDINPPRFSYGDNGGGQGGGKGSDGPGDGSERIRFSLPFDRLMELMAEKLRLPNLLKEGQGKIKEVSYEFKTFGTAGVILDKKRTFRRALKSNIGTGDYNPDEDKYDLLIRRKDRRYKLPERVEKPKFKAVCFYMGDISYSTYGERLELEKRIVGFIHNWINYNYGKNNVEHRFFVHDSEAHEVMEEDFFKVTNAGGTRASIVFDLVSRVAFNEYDPETTNFYGFYFGDGELYSNDAEEIGEILNKDLFPIFNRIGIVEVKPSSISNLVDRLRERYADDNVIRLDRVDNKKEIIKAIKNLFGEKQYA